MASSVPYAKANLLAICAAAVYAPVSWGYPGHLIEHEHVWIDDAVGRETPSIGQVSHRETYTLPVVVAVRAEGDDHQAAEELAWTYANDIDAAIRLAPDLNGAQGVTAAYVTGHEVQGHVADAARAVAIVIEVHIEGKV